MISKLLSFEERIKFYDIDLTYLKKFGVHDKEPFKELSEHTIRDMPVFLRYFYVSSKKNFRTSREWKDEALYFQHPNPMGFTDFESSCDCFHCRHAENMNLQGYYDELFDKNYRSFGFDCPFLNITELHHQKCFKCPACETFNGWKNENLCGQTGMKVTCKKIHVLLLIN